MDFCEYYLGLLYNCFSYIFGVQERKIHYHAIEKLSRTNFREVEPDDFCVIDKYDIV